MSLSGCSDLHRVNHILKKPLFDGLKAPLLKNPLLGHLSSGSFTKVICCRIFAEYTTGRIYPR